MKRGLWKAWDTADVGQLVEEVRDVVFSDDEDGISILVPVGFLSNYELAAGVEIDCCTALLLQDDTVIAIPGEFLSVFLNVLPNIFPNVFANAFRVFGVGDGVGVGVGNGVALPARR